MSGIKQQQEHRKHRSYNNHIVNNCRVSFQAKGHLNHFLSPERTPEDHNTFLSNRRNFNNKHLAVLKLQHLFSLQYMDNTGEISKFNFYPIHSEVNSFLVMSSEDLPSSLIFSTGTTCTSMQHSISSFLNLKPNSWFLFPDFHLI